MTHSLHTSPQVTQPGTGPPAADQPPVGDPSPPRADQGSATGVAAEVIAARLSGLHTMRGDLVQLLATVTADGTAVVVDLTRLSVAGAEASARVVLTLSVPARADAAGEQAEGGRSAT